jgi:hypothetical protein
MDEEFCFVVGSPWDNGSNNINSYTYYNQVQFGTLKDAVEFKKYVEKQTGKENFIYRLEKINDSYVQI